METAGWFDGKPAKIRHSGGTTEIFYGGAWGNIPGDGHGHVKAQGGPLGEFIVYWRLSAVRPSSTTGPALSVSRITCLVSGRVPRPGQVTKLSIFPFKNSTIIGT